MADPVSLAAISIGATAGGGLLGAFGSAQQGQASKNLYGYQASVALINKQIADQNASYATAAGEVSAQQSDMQTRSVLGQTKATQGAGGLDVNKGSNVNVRASEAEVGAENTALVRSNAARQAYGFEVQGAQDVAQAGVDTMAGSQSLLAGYIGAGSSILGAGASVSSKWLAAQQAGIFT